MTLPNPNPFAGRSPDWVEGYQFGVESFASDLRYAQSKGILADAGEVARLRAALEEIASGDIVICKPLQEIARAALEKDQQK